MYKGSLLRGAFGHALRRAVCAMGPRQPCETCSLSRACVYPRLFEAFASPEPPPYLHGQPAAPRPFVFEPGDERRDFHPGEHLPFDLLLFGDAVALSPRGRGEYRLYWWNHDPDREDLLPYREPT